MLCSRFVRGHEGERHGRFYQACERVFEAARFGYERTLLAALNHRFVVLLVFLATVAVTVGLYTLVPKDFLPSGDIGQLIITTEGPQDASFDYMVQHQQQLVDIVSRDPNVESYNSTIGAIGFRVTQNQGSIFMK